MAFRKKAAALAAEAADILVLPECECPDRLQFRDGERLPSDSAWFGSNPHKGLGVLAYGAYRLRVLHQDHGLFRTIVPIEVTGGPMSFTLFAVWANNPSDKDGAYVTQVWKAVQHYEQLFRKGPVLLAGDFNSNSIWDRPRRVGNHSALVQRLAGYGIHSLYHRHYAQEHGKELHPTHYLYRHADKPYHLDYCFASNTLLQRLDSIRVGVHHEWSAWSDHMPLIAEFRDAD